MYVADFDYHLPEELIAQQPIEPRDHSRLLVVKKAEGTTAHKHFYDLGEYLNHGDVLVFNDTRVIPARLIGKLFETGGKIEVFLLNRRQNNEWEVLVKPGKKARTGKVVDFCGKLKAEIIDVTEFGGRIVRFIFDGVFEEILDELGETPLPPYIHEHLEDKERYQTVYARERGSAAAPTAGLHFTKELLQKFQSTGIKIAFVTLHVGLGTFRPVTAETLNEHVMHREYYSIPAETAKIINDAKENGNKVIAVGTTSVRTLEIAANSAGKIEAGSGWTDIFIYPGYSFKLIDAMITNFHLPKSTLLMLICAFATQEKIFEAYAEAKKNHYKFFSFGDAMLII